MLCDFDSVFLRSITQQHHTHQVAKHNAMKVAERKEVKSKPRQMCDFDSVLLRSITQQHHIHQVAEHNAMKPKPRQLCNFDSVLLRSITQQHHIHQVAEHNAMKPKPRQLCNFDSVLLRSITRTPSSKVNRNRWLSATKWSRSPRYSALNHPTANQQKKEPTGLYRKALFILNESLCYSFTNFLNSLIPAPSTFRIYIPDGRLVRSD